MKKKMILPLIFLGVLAGSYAQQMSLREAVSAIAAAVEAKVPGGSEIAIAEITAPLPELSSFLIDELDSRFSINGKLKVLARGKALEMADLEHTFQMSGLVSDESAVGIGHYLGAKAVITGTFDRFSNLSQLWIRAVDVQKGTNLLTYSVRIRSTDPILADLTKSLENAQAAIITEKTLEHLNQGKGYFAEHKFDLAIAEFTQALALNKELTDAYFYRGFSYISKEDYEGAVADYTEVLRFDPNNTLALNGRSLAYQRKGDHDRAIGDYTAYLRLKPQDAVVLVSRGFMYRKKKEYNRAIEDFTNALRLDPQDISALGGRGLTYQDKEDNHRAIEDFTRVLQINPNLPFIYFRRGLAYFNKGDYDWAVSDFMEAVRLDPSDRMYQGMLQLARNERLK